MSPARRKPGQWRPGKWIGATFTPEQERARELWSSANARMWRAMSLCLCSPDGDTTRERFVARVARLCRICDGIPAERRAACQRTLRDRRELDRLMDGLDPAAAAAFWDRWQTDRAAAKQLFPDVEDSFTIASMEV